MIIFVFAIDKKIVVIFQTSTKNNDVGHPWSVPRKNGTWVLSLLDYFSTGGIKIREKHRSQSFRSESFAKIVSVTCRTSLQVTSVKNLCDGYLNFLLRATRILF